MGGRHMTQYKPFERVHINIPVGATLTASNGVFLFKSGLTDTYYACKKVKYIGDGYWDCLDEKIEINKDEIEVRK